MRRQSHLTTTLFHGMLQKEHYSRERKTVATADAGAVHVLHLELDEEDTERLARMRILLSADEGEVIATALEVLDAVATNQALGGTASRKLGGRSSKLSLRLRIGDAHEYQDKE